MNRPQLDTLDEYRQRFADVDYWRPYAQAVCERHGFKPCRSVVMRTPGTCPTLIVDDQWVVKFYGRLFDGGDAIRAEREANRLVAGGGFWPAPAVLGEGRLYDDDSAGWPWPYLIFQFVPGDNLSAVYDQVPFADRLAIAERLGELARRLHCVPLDGSAVFLPTWDAYAGLLAERRAACVEDHRRWGTPDRLVRQLDRFLPPAGALFDPAATPQPCLLHADLTADHVLGGFAAGRWTMTGLIDFGDAMTGDPAYELVALHLDAFRCDKRLLRAFLLRYGASGGEARALTRRAMNLMLLHRFNVLSIVPRDLVGAGSLEALMALLWDVDAPA